jgi:hypothetical protein
MAGVATTVLALSALALSPVASVSPAGTPTVTIKPDKGLIGNQTLKIAGKNWSAASTVGVGLCGGTPQSESGACPTLAQQQPSAHGSSLLTYEPLVGRSPIAGRVRPARDQVGPSGS